MQNAIAATRQKNRIQSLDFLRGIAVLGILIMNIESFCYPNQWSPYAYGFESAQDHTVRFWVYLLCQGKFFGMFSILFGVGFYIFLERLEKKGLGLKAVDIYARRLLLLFLIGVIHAYFIWNGDILYHYAICGFLLFPFRVFSAKRLVLILLIPVAVLSYNAVDSVLNKQQQYQEYLEALDADTPTDEQKMVIEKWQKSTSPKEGNTDEIESGRDTYWQSVEANAEHVKVLKGEVFYSGILYRTLILMIIGIILYKLNVFSDYKSVKYYWLITAVITALALYINYARYYHWTFEYYKPVLNIWQGLLFAFPKEIMALAYILVFNGFYQKLARPKWFTALSLAGRMALTNYIIQNIICGLLFYGYGFSLYGQLARHELLYVVVCIWGLQLIWSYFWFKKFEYGPLEWCWRRLTYLVI
ncbi:DUF418 domain-containing protein [Fulvivirga maritima]|uniref:DUF418 domain-containing protein n=1 Tax=Fulvivirga maritima TaxID=2904247 RepID=UPI001F1F2D87|nr:DUF418 domain-containing protein [Fulvivirga maritima]UII27912.1 DUF418 domain-containing protein [Fulvivirga maritima]